MVHEDFDVSRVWYMEIFLGSGEKRKELAGWHWLVGIGWLALAGWHWLVGIGWLRAAKGWLRVKGG